MGKAITQAPYSGQLLLSLTEQRQCTFPLVISIEAIIRPLNGRNDFFTVAQQIPPFQELLFFTALQVGALQILDLKLQCVNPPGLFRLIHLQGRDLVFDPLQGGILLLVGGL